MIIDIVSYDFFDTMNSGLIGRYLEVTNWKRVEHSLNGVTIWDNVRSDGKPFRVWLPQSVRFSDYSQSMARVVKTIAEYEERSQLQVVEDFETIVVGDVVRVSTEDEYQSQGSTLALRDGIDLLVQARDLMTSAALSTLTPREVYPPRRPNQVLQYIDSVRVGQTERGSYVVKLVSPINHFEYLQWSFDSSTDYSQPFPRQVVITLVKGLDALGRVALEAERRGRVSFEAFQEVVNEGVSANLCEAIAVADDKERIRPTEIEVSWSVLLKSPGISQSQVNFPARVVPYIAEAAKLFRERNPEEIRLVGRVTVHC